MKSMTDYFGRSPKGDELLNNTKKDDSPKHTPPMSKVPLCEKKSSSEHQPANALHSDKNLKFENLECHAEYKASPQTNKPLTSKVENNFTENSVNEKASLPPDDKKRKKKRSLKIEIKLNGMGSRKPLDEDLIDQESHSVVKNGSTNGSKTVKSPESTMLRYLVSKPNLSTEQKCSELCSKNEKTPPSTINGDCHRLENGGSQIKLPEPDAHISIQDVGITAKPNKTPKRKEKSSRKKKESDANIKNPTSKDLPIDTPKSSMNDNLSNPPKLSRRKLSLSRSSSNLSEKNLNVPSSSQSENESQLTKSSNILVSCTSEESTIEEKACSKSVMATNMTSALKNILSKSPMGHFSGSDQSMQDCLNPHISKKFKLDTNEEDGQDCDSVKDSSRQSALPTNTSLSHDSDVAPKPRLRKCAESLSDENDENEGSVSKDDGSKRNSLMKYFSKISREDALLQSEKVEMKVKVMVHSPPTTPSKKKKKRSTKSLPGGSTSTLKKKGKHPKSEQKDDVDAIDLVGVEEIKPSDSETDSVPTSGTSCSPSSLCKPETGSPGAHKTVKKSTSGTKTALPVSPSNTSEAAASPVVPGKTQILSSSSSEHGEKFSKDVNFKSPRPSIRSWQMRVSLASPSLPSSRGTLHEEESESDEIYANRKKKKRKIIRKKDTSTLENTGAKIAPLLNQNVHNELKEVEDKGISVTQKRKRKHNKNLVATTEKLQESGKNKNGCLQNGLNGQKDALSRKINTLDKNVKLAPLFIQKAKSESEEDIECVDENIKRTSKTAVNQKKMPNYCEEILPTSHLKSSKPEAEIILENEVLPKSEVAKMAPLFNRNFRGEFKEDKAISVARKEKEGEFSKKVKVDQFQEREKSETACASNCFNEMKKAATMKADTSEKEVKLAPLFKRITSTDSEEDSDCDEMFPIHKNKAKAVTKRKLRTSESLKVTKRNCALPAARFNHVNPSKMDAEIIFEKEVKKEDVKIAPLFSLKNQNEARQQFLKSGMPEQIVRLREEQRSFEGQECDLFPKQSHIQQKEDDEFWKLSAIDLSLLPDTTEPPQIHVKVSMGDFTNCVSVNEDLQQIMSTSCEGPKMHNRSELPFTIVKPLLKRLRKGAPTFKVAKTYKALHRKFLDEKRSREKTTSAILPSRPTRKSRKAVSSRQSTQGTLSYSSALPYSQVWTEKYKPTTSSEIVGNTECVRKLSNWLEAWRKVEEEINKQNHESNSKRVKRRKKEDDGDDFVVSDYSSDEDTRNLPDSVAVLFGTSGCGKTCTVYAVAKDLGFKVLEVNASEKRSGKIVLAKLSEATQSHQVQRSSSSEQFHAWFHPNSKRKAKEKSAPKAKNQTEDETSRKMSLILFEDVDVVFEEEDDGFLSAISNLIATSKRPVILTATDLESSSVLRFLNNSSLILQFSPARDLISTWLQLVSLLEGVHVSSRAVSDLLTVYNGDFRRALLQMQLWVTSGGNNLPAAPLPKSIKGNKKCTEEDITDDDVILSSDEVEDLNLVDSLVPMNTDCLGAVLGRNDVAYPQHASKPAESCGIPPMEIPFPLGLGLYWWNIPRTLLLRQITHYPPSPLRPSINTGRRRLLDDSFIENFCSDDENFPEVSCPAPEQDIKTCDSVDNTQKIPCQNEFHDAQPKETHLKPKISCTSKEMNAILQQIVCLSSIDIFSSAHNLPEARNDVEPLSIACVAKDGLSLLKVDFHGPNSTMESTARELCHWLGEKCLLETRSCILACDKILDFSQCSYDPCLPSSEEKEWRSARADADDRLLTAIPFHMHLEHRAIFMDYLPALRTLCRLEQSRSIINTKRRNRFYHYLKSLGANLLDNQLDLICNTMCNDMLSR